MKNKIGFFALALLALSSQTRAEVYLSPHIGIDWKYWGAEPYNGLPLPADKTFPTISNAFSFYLGTRINDYWGIDFGYDQSLTKETSRVFNGMETFLTQTPEPVGNSSTVRVRLKAWYLHGYYYWEMMQDTELVALLGLSTLKPDTHIYYVTGGERTEVIQNTRSKVSARIGLGLQYTPLWYLSFRGMVIWDQTRRINYLGADPTQAAFDLSPYKSATSFHLGFLFNLSKPRLNS